MKKYKTTLLLTSLIILLPMLPGVLLWNRLPERVATHFTMDGTPDGWSNRGFAVFGLPLFILGVHALCSFATFVDPKNENMSEKLKNLMFWICPAISILIPITVYGHALGYEVNMGVYAGGLVGVLCIVVGNYLPKCKQNYTMGIKLPWTLHDEDNWNRTHRVAGFLWVVCGFVMLANVFIQKEWLHFTAFAVMVLVPTVYSYLYYRKHGEKKEAGK